MFGSLLALVAGFFKSFSSAFKSQTSAYRPKRNDVPFEERFVAEEMLVEENDAYVPFYDETDDYDDYGAEIGDAEDAAFYEQYSDEANDIEDTDDTYNY